MPDGYDDVNELLRRLASLLEEIDRLGDGVRDIVYATLDTADELHRRSLRRLGDVLDVATLERLRGHPDIGWLLDVYGVGADQDAAAQVALADLRPYLTSRGGGAELLQVIDGVVRLRLIGACATGAEAPELLEAIDRALQERVPGFVRVDPEHEPSAAEPLGALLEIQPRPPEAEPDEACRGETS